MRVIPPTAPALPDSSQLQFRGRSGSRAIETAARRAGELLFEAERCEAVLEELEEILADAISWARAAEKGQIIETESWSIAKEIHRTLMAEIVSAISNPNPQACAAGLAKMIPLSSAVTKYLSEWRDELRARISGST